ncbi:MAG: hypothetical protein J7501_07205 [Bdellovibrio sp.]|nr:hypothetical protein [Bdellovibrio sp.]
MTLLKHLPLVAFLTMTALSLEGHAISSTTVSARAQQPVRAVVVVAAPTQQAQAMASKVKSYREWKTEMVAGAQYKVSSVKSQIEARKQTRRVAQGTDPNLARSGRGVEAVPARDISLEGLEKQLRQEQYDLEVAQDLSVTDYFVGYLTKIQDKKSAFKEVAGKLSPEEVAELMNAYANSVFGAHSSDLPASATNTTKDGAR